MLQWEWPTVWDAESRETVRVGLEKAIRSAMAKSPSTQIRGTVTVDLPHLGSTPPRLVLSGIRELSLERTALMLHFSYTGDFTVALRGLQINLDTVGGGEVDETDSHLAAPFFCPFEMTLQNIVLDGMASIEITQDVERRVKGEHSAVIANIKSAPPSGASSHCVAANASPEMAAGFLSRSIVNHSFGTPRSEARPRLSGVAATGAMPASPDLIAATLTTTSAAVTPAPEACASSRSLRTSRSRPAAGYGALLTAGGRRRMRRPAAQPIHSETRTGIMNGHRFTSEMTSMKEDSMPSSAPHGRDSCEGATRSQEQLGVADVLLGKAVVRRRQVKVQLFGDPLKSFAVVSNFGAVPGVNKRVEETLKLLIRPAIQHVMTEGVSFTV